MKIKITAILSTYIYFQLSKYFKNKHSKLPKLKHTRLCFNIFLTAFSTLKTHPNTLKISTHNLYKPKLEKNPTKHKKSSQRKDRDPSRNGTKLNRDFQNIFMGIPVLRGHTLPRVVID